MSSTSQKWAFPASVGLIASSLIGAGILALPASLGIGGFYPSLLMMVIYGGLMLFSGEVLLREAAARPGEVFNLTALYQSYFGRFGKWIAVAANLLVLYGLLTAYVTGGAKVLGSLLGVAGSPFYITLLLAILPVTLAVMKLSVIQKCNMVLMLAVIAAFAVMLGIGESHADFSRLNHVSWKNMPNAIPLILTAFYFHNIIPVVSTQLAWNEKRIRRAAFCGIAIAFAMCALWLQTGISVLPLSGENSVMETYLAAEPATIPMSRVIGSRLFVLAATGFALLTVLTAFAGNGVALQSFLSELLPRASRMTIRAAALAPPVLIAVIWPNLFLKAVDVVGGIGIVTLFGILPCLVAIRKRSNKPAFRVLGAAFLLLALLALGIEVVHEFSGAHPAEFEYWKHDTHKILEKHP